MKLIKSNQEIIFTETQKFRQWWLWILLLTGNGISAWGFIKQVLLQNKLNNDSLSDGGLYAILIFSVLLSIFIFIIRLDTGIDKQGIYVRFFPFQIRFKYYPWENCKKIEIRKYNPILEYGGWGIRYGLFGNGKAISISGNKGIQLEFKDNSRLLIGTRKSEILTSILMEITKNS